MHLLLTWAPLAGVLIAAAAWFTPYPADVGAAGALVVAVSLLVRRIRHRRLLAEFRRRAGAPRRQRRARHRDGGRAVWRVTRGQL